MAPPQNAQSPHSPNAGGAEQRSQPPLAGLEFVVMMAAIMALNALAIDSMLPALPDMARGLGVVAGNDQQNVITLYFIGLAAGALVYGPLADRYGRRRVLLFSLIGYVLAGLATGLATSWIMLLSFRFIHGLFGAAMGVVTTAIVRDRLSGDAMARLMSMIFLVFMVVPIIAPTIGQAVLTFADWRWIFLLLAGMGLVMALWVSMRLPETLDPADVTAIDLRSLARGWVKVSTHRQSLAYLLGSSIATGSNFGFLNSSQQIFSQTFGRADIFPYAFASVAAGMAIANFSNSVIVLKFGARRVAQTALILSILLSIAQWVAAGAGENMYVFLFILMLNMSMIGFIGANFSSIAMEPFGHIAGTAASFQTSVRTLISASIGAVIGHAYDGTTVPLALGFFIGGMAALIIIMWGEKGRLFTRPNAPHRPQPRA